MSFISKLKSPLMKRHLMFHDNNHLENDKPTRNLIIYHIDATDNEGTLSLTVNVIFILFLFLFIYKFYI